MNESLYQFISLDLPPLLAALFAAGACSILGSYLVLRRQSLMGDAISHSVLPGIVVGFLVTGSRGTVPIFIGAAVAGVMSAFLIEIVRRHGKVDESASMGVIFSTFFALGVLTMEQAAARSVDLDADCLLHGQLEAIFWYPPRDWRNFLSLSTLAGLPSEVYASAITAFVVVCFVALLWKELKLSSFDPALSTALGFHSGFLHQALMVLLACAVVASFKIVGSILVIGMLICPPATARMCTDRLSGQLILSVVFSMTACIIGYVLGAFGPQWLGYNHSVSAAGMIAVVCGVFLGVAIFCAPHHGIISRSLRRFRLKIEVTGQDILAQLYRQDEGLGELAADAVRAAPPRAPALLHFLAVRSLRRQTLISFVNGKLSLTEGGRQAAQAIVRSHRLWEGYLTSIVGLSPDHVHDTAEILEHFTDNSMQTRISEKQGRPVADPHGRTIPSDSGE